MCHIVHMKRVSIRELHLRTGEWVRQVAAQGRIVITDRGRPVASLVPHESYDTGTPFSARRLLPEFAALSPVRGDSSTVVSEDRDRS
jgi:prevent-host-death family protein